MKVFIVVRRQTSISYSVLGILEKTLDDVRGQRKRKMITHQRRFSMADQELEMIAVIGKIAAARIASPKSAFATSSRFSTSKDGSQVERVQTCFFSSQTLAAPLRCTQ